MESALSKSCIITQRALTNPMPVPQKTRCKVEKIIKHGEHVYTVDLLPERIVPRFRPGQFLHLALEHYDPSGFWPESRVFSIASSTIQRDRLKISYSVVGRFTTRMEQELVEGGLVWVKMPYGDFIIDDSKDGVLFAGGTGITAFTAFMESLTSAFQHQVTLFYGVRNSDHLIYREMVEARIQAVPQLQVYYFIENPESDEIDSWHMIPGRLSVSKAWSEIKNPLEANYFLSGPPMMLKVITEDLRDHRVPIESIYIDAWE
jgi:ferredoxin-NADP reductase